MKFIKKYAHKLILTTFIVFLPVFSFGQTNVPGPCVPTGGTICNPITTNTINDFIRVILEGVLKIGIPVVALAIIYCGFLFVKARGNSEELSKAKDALLYTVIGAAVLLGSWALAKLISETILALG